MKTHILLAAAACALATPAIAQVMTPAEYVAAAGASDLYERTSSQLVLKSTANPKVRNFAQMMVSAHAKSTADVKAAAKQSRLTPPPPKLTPAQTEMVAQLTAEKGAARDTAYIAQQRAAHNQALQVQKAYAKEGAAQPLRRAATGIVPVVEGHIKELMAM